MSSPSPIAAATLAGSAGTVRLASLVPGTDFPLDQAALRTPPVPPVAPVTPDRARSTGQAPAVENGGQSTQPATPDFQDPSGRSRGTIQWQAQLLAQGEGLVEDTVARSPSAAFLSAAIGAYARNALQPQTRSAESVSLQPPLHAERLTRAVDLTA